MMLQCIAYNIALLSRRKTLFPKISNFCSSLGLHNIDERCFVVNCQNLPKSRTNVLHPKMCKIACSFSDFLRNFCHKFNATFGFFECNFLGGLSYVLLLTLWIRKHHHGTAKSTELQEKSRGCFFTPQPCRWWLIFSHCRVSADEAGEAQTQRIHHSRPADDDRRWTHVLRRHARRTVSWTVCHGVSYSQSLISYFLKYKK